MAAAAGGASKSTQRVSAHCESRFPTFGITPYTDKQLANNRVGLICLEKTM